MPKNMKRLWAVLCCIGLLTGCDRLVEDESSSATTNSPAATDAETSETSTAEGASAPAPVDFTLAPYPLERSTCAMMIPSTFQVDSPSILSESVSLSGESPNDAINLMVYDAWDETEFASFTEDDLFSMIYYSVTLPELQYFEEAQLSHANGLSYKAYIGEAVGTIDGEPTYINILSVNCPDTGKMYVLSMRDQDGEYQAYREHLADYLYLGKNGFVAENDTLIEAPTPEPIVYTNDELGYTIHLPETWQQADEEMKEYLRTNVTYDYDSLDIFIDRSLNSLTIAAKSLDEFSGSSALNSQTFYAAMDQAKEWMTGAGGNELVASKSCEIGTYPAYQLMIDHTAGATPSTSVSWFILQDDDHQQMMCISYRYYEDTDAAFAEEVLNCISFQEVIPS